MHCQNRSEENLRRLKKNIGWGTLHGEKSEKAPVDCKPNRRGGHVQPKVECPKFLERQEDMAEDVDDGQKRN